MRNRANTGGLMTFMAAIILTLAIPTLALADTNLKPVCGAEGDPVLIMGEDFAENPTVKFDGVVAKIVESTNMWGVPGHPRTTSGLIPSSGLVAFQDAKQFNRFVNSELLAGLLDLQVMQATTILKNYWGYRWLLDKNY